MSEPSPLVSAPLPVMEHFATIQGEGFHSGTPAYFIRLGGCDVGCHWCDVKESWPLDGYAQMTPSTLAETVQSSGLQVCVVTGGEPALHALDKLCDSLHELHIRTHIETSGVHPLTGSWDWVTFSPKKFKQPLPEVAKVASELKVIINHKSDFEFAEQHAHTVSETCQLFLQPEWDKRETMMPLIIAYIKQHPKWRISLQTHKYLNIP